METIFDKIASLAEAVQKEIVSNRRHIHMHPETSVKEIETTKFIKAKLEEIGYKNIHVGVPGHSVGVWTDIEGVSPHRIALRADIDALPLCENNELEYKSVNAGAAHLCGHDAHTAMLLGAAKILYELQPLPCNVRLIFQPAEEMRDPATNTPGAALMIASGALENVDMRFGLHVRPSIPTGLFSVHIGGTMSEAGMFTLKLKGRGGHGSVPHECIDPITCACDIVNAWQKIISREVRSGVPAVLSLGKFIADGSWNTVADEVEIKGTTRTFDGGTSEFILNRMKEIAEGYSSAMRCKADFSGFVSDRAVVNNAEACSVVSNAVVSLYGSQSLIDAGRFMGTEDFSCYQEKAKSALFFLGIGNAEKGTTYPLHSPQFKLDEDVLCKGAAVMAAIPFAYNSRL